jgi:hypothetical protein
MTEVWGVEFLERLLNMGRRRGAMRTSADFSTDERASAALSLAKEEVSTLRCSLIKMGLTHSTIPALKKYVVHTDL